MDIHTRQRSYNFHIRKAIKYMQQHYTEALTLEYMAKYLGLNKCYFCQLFKRETQRTFSQYLNEIRIEQSKHLLLHTNLSLLEVAFSVGYNNQNYFNMTFKKLTDTTPRKYRNQKKL